MSDLIDRQVIDTGGLEEEIRCTMCRNPMHTDKGCDGGCRYDERLHKEIMQVLERRIKPIPAVQPETATVTIARTKGGVPMWYECDACGEPIDQKDYYCRNCGRKLKYE